MTSPGPMRLEHVIARAMAELRLSRGWTQADLAWRMTEMGLAWTPNRVTQLETLRRPVSLFELAALAWVFEVPVTDLLPGDQQIEAPDGKTVVNLRDIRAALTGDTSAQQRSREAQRRRQTYTEEIRRVAKSLDLDPEVLNWLSRELYGRSFVDERDERAGDLSGVTKQSARTRRGHATRTLTAEIGEHLTRKGRDAVIAAYRHHVAQKVAERFEESANARTGPPEETDSR